MRQHPTGVRNAAAGQSPLQGRPRRWEDPAAEETWLPGVPPREGDQVGEAPLPRLPAASFIEPHQSTTGRQPHPAAETRWNRKGILDPIGSLQRHLPKHRAGSSDLPRHRHSIASDPDPTVDRRERSRRERERPGRPLHPAALATHDPFPALDEAKRDGARRRGARRRGARRRGARRRGARRRGAGLRGPPQNPGAVARRLRPNREGLARPALKGGALSRGHGARALRHVLES